MDRTDHRAVHPRILTSPSQPAGATADGSPAPAAEGEDLLPPSTLPASTAVGPASALLLRSERLVEEDDEGSVEYKWRLTKIAKSRFDHLVTQMKFRVAEGAGECLYELGVADDGFPRGLNPGDFDESLDTIRRMATVLGFNMHVVCERVVSAEPVLLRCAEVRVRKQVPRVPTARVALIGEAGAGKSTLMAALSDGVLDDGRGSARQSVFNHKHELRSGKTTSIAEKVVGFDATGAVVNYDAAEGQQVRTGALQKVKLDDSTAVAAAPGAFSLEKMECCEEAIVAHSAVCARLLDMPGDPKHRTTAVGGLVARTPHAVLLTVDVSNPKLTTHCDQLRTDLARCHVMKLRFAVLLTKSDKCGALAVPQALTLLSSLTRELCGKETRLETDATMTAAASAHRRSSSNGFMMGGSASHSASMSDFFLDGSSRGSTPHCHSPVRAGGDEPFTADSPKKAADDAQSTTTGCPAAAYVRRLDSTVPVFIVSAVSGVGMAALKAFLFYVAKDNAAAATAASVKAPVPALALAGGAPVPRWQDGAFIGVTHFSHIPSIGYIASGTVRGSEHIAVGDRLFIGPTVDGRFEALPDTGVVSIHSQRSFCDAVAPGLDGAFALGSTMPSTVDPLRKGTYLWKPPSGKHSTPIKPPRGAKCVEIAIEKTSAPAAGTTGAPPTPAAFKLPRKGCEVLLYMGVARQWCKVDIVHSDTFRLKLRVLRHPELFEVGDAGFLEIPNGPMAEQVQMVACRVTRVWTAKESAATDSGRSGEPSLSSTPSKAPPAAPRRIDPTVGLTDAAAQTTR